MEVLKEKIHSGSEIKTRVNPRKVTKPASTRGKPSKKLNISNEETVKKPHNQELGKRGEDAASAFLERKGFTILARNWSCQAGEVDIVADDQGTLVFIEVKTRSNCGKGFPEEAVTAQKRNRYEKIASFYLRDHDVANKAIRFDVISILAVAPERAFLRHHRDAFSANE